MHLEESGKRRRVENIWTVPWGLHFDALECGSGWMERKYFVGLLKRKLEIVQGERDFDFRMNFKAEVVVIPMMLQAQQHPILQGVDSPEIVLCPCGRTRKLAVGVGGIGERIFDEC